MGIEMLEHHRVLGLDVAVPIDRALDLGAERHRFESLSGQHWQTH